MNTVHAKINGIPVEVDAGTSILLAARKVGVHIPTLCYHPDLKPFGSCGMCIVKQEGSPKIMRACASPVDEGRSYITDDAELRKVRKEVLQLTLSTHPTGCLTCVRNRQCELQSLAEELGVREQPFQPNVDYGAKKDESTPSIVLDPVKCIKCGRCVQVCQDMQGVFALEFIGRGADVRMAPAAMLKLNDSPCIKCGQCAAHCPVGAIYEKDQTADFEAAVNDPEKTVVVEIAPAVRVGLSEEFGLPPGSVSTGKIYTALRRLGAAYVHDTNFAADLTIMEEGYELVRRLTSGGVLPQFTSCCPGWVNYCEEYYPDLLDNLSTAKSPMQMQGPMTKTYFAKNRKLDPSKIYLVAIMPCTAKKYEIVKDDSMRSSGYQDTDLVLTTRELARLIRRAGIDFVNLPESEADDPLGEYSGAGTIFGATGGVMEAAIRTAYHVVTGSELDRIEVTAVRGLENVKRGEIDMGGRKVRVAVVHGMANAKPVLDEIRACKQAGKPAPYDFVEVMACRGGCVGGGGQPYGTNDEVRAERAAGLYADDERCTVRRSHENPSIQRIYREFLGKPLSEVSEKYLHTSYRQMPLYKA